MFKKMGNTPPRILNNTYKSDTYSSDRGRTLTEMLSTLAMMGVLSVVGVWGYSTAMDAHHTNRVIDSLSKMSVSAMEQMQFHNNFSLAEFNHKTDNGYTVSELIYGKEPIWGIRVEELPQNICKRIIAMGWKTPKEIAIDGVVVTDASACSEPTTMDFIFSKDLNSDDYQVERCTETSDCSSACDSCVDGVCQENCASGESCVYRPTGRQNVTNKTMCCPTERIMNGICCNSVQYDETTGEKLCCPTSSAGTNKCCPEGEFWNLLNQKCYACSEPQNIRNNETEFCSVCENRYINGLNCDPSCPEGMTAFNGACYCPDDKPVQGYLDRKCYSCPDNKQGVWAIRTFELLNSGPTNLTLCRPAAYCGNYRCHGGYIIPCGQNQIGSIFDWNDSRKDVNFYLKDGTKAKSSYPTECYDCTDVDISTIKFKAQCEICGGTWSGENWYTGTCTPGS